MAVAPTAPIVSSAVEAGAYITDGEHLFRVVRPFVDDFADSALLEDCLTFEVLVYTSDELAEMPLRPVQPVAG